MAVTGATVPTVAPVLVRDGVYTARPVRGGQVQIGGLGLVANHLHGRGNVLIPHTRTRSQFTKNGEITLRFKAWPSYACRRRLWVHIYERAVTTEITSVRFTDPSGGTHTNVIPAGAAGTLFTHEAIEDVGTPSASETELAPKYAETSNVSAPYLHSVACFELPRTDLVLDANEYGVRLDTLNPGAVVYTTTGIGIGAIATALDAADSVAQRAGLFQFARGDNNYLSTTSGSLTPVFLSGAVPVLLGRKQYRTSTTKTVKVRARASAGAATTGEIVFTMTSGATLTLTITSGMAAAWLSGDLAVDCDDLSVTDGRRSSRDDKCVIEWRVTGGANPISLQSIHIGNG